jgi:hypothetical protein
MTPPAELAGSHIVEYAVVDETVTFTGRLTMYIGDQRLGAVPGLALGEDLKTGEITLFHCNESWEIIAFQPLGKDSSGHEASMAAAKSRVENYYQGISTRWTPHPSSREEAVASAQAGECSFCRRSIYEIANIIEGPTGARICDICIRELHTTLLEES